MMNLVHQLQLMSILCLILIRSDLTESKVDTFKRRVKRFGWLFGGGSGSGCCCDTTGSGATAAPAVFYVNPIVASGAALQKQTIIGTGASGLNPLSTSNCPCGQTSALKARLSKLRKSAALQKKPPSQPGLGAVSSSNKLTVNGQINANQRKTKLCMLILGRLICPSSPSSIT